MPRRRDHDVAGLQIAVHDAAAVRRAERVRHLRGERERVADRERAAVERPGQRLPLDILHDDVAAAVLGDPGLVDGADAGMIQRRGGARLAQQPAAGVGVGEFFRGDELDRHVAPERQIVGEVDLTQTAAAKEPDDAVAAGVEGSSGVRHGRRGV